MCGIAGIVGRDRSSPEAIEAMTRRLHHRGPDDSGTWCDDGVRLGHARLSILDLSEAGHQPMHLGPCSIVYNGEVYNFRELRRQLDGPFRSDCDTEVLLHLHARDGEGFVPSLRGMFAFAIWDREKRSLFAARDRLGMKPFYYRLTEDGIAFASEIKALLELGPAEIDQSALRDYFTYKYIPAPKTIYRGIAQLPPAHVLRWDGRLRVERYWSPPSEVLRRDPDEAREELGSLLSEIVPEHLMADVPVGVFLSAGIDSTTIAAHLDRPRTFTLGADVKRRDEAPWARRTAEFLGCEHHESVAGSFGLEEALETVPRVWDEPFGDSSAWSNWLVSRHAREHVTVALSGDGGDELFCGYPWYSKFLTDRATPLQALMARFLPTFARAARSAQRRSATGLERYAAHLGPFTKKQVHELLTPELLEQDEDELWHFREHWREDLEPLKRLQWIDLHTYLPGDLLTKVDRASMAHSLEVRPPLLDHRLVEFALSLDTSLLRDVPGRRGKLIVRRLMEDRVPPGLFDQPKRGFNLPIKTWLRDQPHLLDAALTRLERDGIIRKPKGANFSHEQVWVLLVLDRWLGTRPGGGITAGAARTG